jgi:hypothetical protein
MSQQYLLPCACGQQHRVAPAQAGEQVRCGCGKSLIVPTLRGLRALELAPESGPARSAPGWSRIHGAIFAISLLVMMAGLALAACSLALYSIVSRHTTDQTTDIIANAELESPVDKLTPVTALAEWQEDVLPGLQRVLEPSWITAQKAAATYLFWAKVGGVLLAAGLLPALGTLFIGRGLKT